MKTFDLSLYLVTESSLQSNLSCEEMVREAIQGGVTMVQLREKNRGSAFLEAEAKKILPFLRTNKIPLIINDDPRVAKRVGADGVHLGCQDMHPREARALLGENAIIGISIESLAHFERADLSVVDYIAASPVFPTKTKDNAREPFLLADLKTLCLKSPVPVVAIGGIGMENVLDVMETQVAGVAVISAICAAQSPRLAANDLKNAVSGNFKKTYRVLSIAGSDSGGGAGIQADLKTFQALGCYGMSAVTALTAQNTIRVKSLFPVSPNFVKEQIVAVLEDIGVDAVKIGMLYSKEIVQVVRDALVQFNVRRIVLDPVMIAKSGDTLLLPEAVEAVKEVLLPIATIVTPNLPELEVLTGIKMQNEDSMIQAGQLLLKKCEIVLVKGGHVVSETTVSDVALSSNEEMHWWRYPRIVTPNTHGTGCTYSAAIAAQLAKGLPPIEAIRTAREYLQRAIRGGSFRKIGSGSGPVEHQCA